MYLKKVSAFDIVIALSVIVVPGSWVNSVPANHFSNLIDWKSIWIKMAHLLTNSYFHLKQLRRRRCLLEYECTEVIKYKLVKNNQTGLPGDCVDKCLAGYLESADGRSCNKCADKCPKSRLIRVYNIASIMFISCSFRENSRIYWNGW